MRNSNSGSGGSSSSSSAGAARRVSSRRGHILSWARVSDKTDPGVTWMPFHFQDGNSNWLVGDALDPTCKVPEFKVVAVQVRKAGADDDVDEGAQARKAGDAEAAAR